MRSFTIWWIAGKVRAEGLADSGSDRVGSRRDRSQYIQLAMMAISYFSVGYSLRTLLRTSPYPASVRTMVPALSGGALKHQSGTHTNIRQCLLSRCHHVITLTLDDPFGARPTTGKKSERSAASRHHPSERPIHISTSAQRTERAPGGATTEARLCSARDRNASSSQPIRIHSAGSE